MEKMVTTKSGIRIEVGIGKRGEVKISFNHPKLGEIKNQLVVYNSCRGGNRDNAWVWKYQGVEAGIILHEKDDKDIMAISENNIKAWMEEAVPGLDEIRAAMEDLTRWEREFNKMMEDENNDGCCPPNSIDIDIVEELEKKYPAAAAYIVAESYKGSSWFIKSAAGSRAAERIMAGEEHGIVMVDMQKEIDAGIDYNN